MFTQYAPLEKRVERAFVRRFGASVMPLEITAEPPCLHHVRDPETGSWMRFDTTGWRIRRLDEHDATGTR